MSGKLTVGRVEPVQSEVVNQNESRDFENTNISIRLPNTTDLTSLIKTHNLPSMGFKNRQEGGMCVSGGGWGFLMHVNMWESPSKGCALPAKGKALAQFGIENKDTFQHRFDLWQVWGHFTESKALWVVRITVNGHAGSFVVCLYGFFSLSAVKVFSYSTLTFRSLYNVCMTLKVQITFNCSYLNV